MIRGRLLALLVVSLASVGGIVSATGAARFREPTTHFDQVIPGKLKYELRSTAGSFTLGQPISVEYVLTNVGTDVLRVCPTCVGESLQAVPDTASEGSRFCGFSSEPEERTLYRNLRPQEEITWRRDISSLSCLQAPGHFELSDAYCQEYGVLDMKESGSVCVHAAPLLIEIGR